ncbi:hypothetical protein MKW92_040866, partial [Papaver armeniacum]
MVFVFMLGSSNSSPIAEVLPFFFFQENAGNIAHLLEMVGILLQELQCNVFMLSYRGYGASDGYPSQHGITRDAQAAMEHLAQRTDIDTSRIVVFGRSLGGAVGSVLTQNKPDKILPFLFSQEKAVNIAHRFEMVRIMLQKLQCNVFMLSYRG